MISDDNPNFLFTTNGEVSFSALESLVEQYKKTYSTITAIAILPGIHSAENYAKLIALIQLNKPFHVCAEWRFNDQEFRRQLPEDLQWDCSFEGELHKSSLQSHPKISALLQSGGSPFIVKTSGSISVKNKYVLHDMRRFPEKYKKIGPQFRRTLAFFPFESIAGLETLFEAYTHHCSLVFIEAPISPERIINTLNTFKVDFFHTTPSFMNLMSPHLEKNKDKLKSLERIAFGSEPSFESTLEHFRKTLPHIQWTHIYGMTEVGILATITDQNRPWLVGLEKGINDYKVMDNSLYIQSMTMMMGYLNVPDSLSDSLWLHTNDEVQVVDSFLKITGRKDGTINVGGRKFFPIEVESELGKLKTVNDAMVYGKAHDILGQIVIAEILLNDGFTNKQFYEEYKGSLESRLPQFMLPSQIKFIDRAALPERFKKIRPKP